MVAVNGGSFMSHVKPEEGQRFSEELHGLRGLAACIVVVGHAANIAMAYDKEFHVPDGLVNGSASVVLFFVLSGLVLSPSSRNAARSGSGLLAFYIRRAFRLMPLMILANAASCLFVIYVHPHLAFPEPLTGPFGLKAFIGGFIGASTKLNGPSWSIFIEVLASILMPIAALAASTRYRFIWLLVAAALAYVPTHLPYAAPIYLLPFYLGALIPTLPNILNGRSRVLIWTLTVICFLAFDFVRPVFQCFQITPNINADPRVVLTEAIFMAPVVYVLYNRPARTFLASRAAQWLGDVSFGLYLLHFNILTLVYNRIGAVHGWPAFMLTAAGTFAITLPLAAIANRYIELPGIKLGRQLAGQAAGWLNRKSRPA
jgi:peptidoglycan/LPS O-acetylase OafA/YrhL